MPLLKTMPGEWPAQVLMATTAGGAGLPLPTAALAAETPSEPLPRSGSGGAFFSESKSPWLTASPLAFGLPFEPVAQSFKSGANRRTLKNAATSSASTMIAFPKGVTFIVFSLNESNRAHASHELIHGGTEGGDEAFRLHHLLHHGAHVAGDFGRAELRGADPAEDHFEYVGESAQLRHHHLVALLAFEQQVALLLEDSNVPLPGAGRGRLLLGQVLERLALGVHLGQPLLDAGQRHRPRSRQGPQHLRPQARADRGRLGRLRERRDGGRHRLAPKRGAGRAPRRGG